MVISTGMLHKFTHRYLIWLHNYGVRKRNKRRTILFSHKKLPSTREKLEQMGKVVEDGKRNGKAFLELRNNEKEEYVNPVDIFPGTLLLPCCNKPTRVTMGRKRRTVLFTDSTQKLTTPSGEQHDSKGENVIEDHQGEKGASESNTETKNCIDPTVLLPAIPLLPGRSNSEPGVIFVLEKASLVPAYVGRTYEILNPDKHADFLRKKKLNPYDYRPDIIHEILVDVLGSRLNMAGAIQAVYVKTDLGQLIRIEPHVRIPPTLGKFCSMMSQLLQKFSIKATGKGKKLLQLIENPLVKHLPLNSKKIGLSSSSPKAVKLQDYVSSISTDVTPVFVIGAMAHGKIDCDFIEDLISVSSLPLSAGVCVRRICYELERRWKIL